MRNFGDLVAPRPCTQDNVYSVDGHHDIGEIFFADSQAETRVRWCESAINRPQRALKLLIINLDSCNSEQPFDLISHINMIKHCFLKLGKPIILQRLISLLRILGIFGDDHCWVFGKRLFVHAFCDLVLVVLSLQDFPGLWQVLENAYVVCEGLGLDAKRLFAAGFAGGVVEIRHFQRINNKFLPIRF